jgi:hypothetical protein
MSHVKINPNQNPAFGEVDGSAASVSVRLSDILPGAAGVPCLLVSGAGADVDLSAPAGQVSSLGAASGDAQIGRSGARIQFFAQTAIKTANYNANADELVRVDPSAGVFTVTLPTAAGRQAIIVIKNVSTSANPVTIAAAGGQTIDGVSSMLIDSAHMSVMLVSNGGTDWMVI